MFVVFIELIVSFIVGIFIVRTYVGSVGHTICVAGAISITCSILIEISIPIFYKNNATYSDNLLVILWWTPLANPHSKAVTRKCYKRTCIFTHQQDTGLTHSHAPKAIAFYGSDVDVANLPLPRNDKVLWALLHEESPKNAPHLISPYFLSLFNFTSTFSRRSHLPLTTLHLHNIDKITDKKYFVSTAEKNNLRNFKSMASVLYVQSNCDTLTERDAFVEELSKYVKVDSFGRCVHNAELPDSLLDPTTFDTEEFFHFVSKYKFTLAIENAVCEDYITEKLWRALIVGSVPIYFGSPSVRDWLPNYDSAILISEFNTVETLAAYIKELDGNDDRYDHYLRHKIEGIISNKFLKNVLRSRRWDGYDSLIEEFECQLCLRLHQFDEEGSETYEKFRVDETHYYCPFPTNPSLPVEKTASDESTDNSWFSILRNARCEGRAVFEFVSEGVSYSRQELDQRSHQLMQDNAC